MRRNWTFLIVTLVLVIGTFFGALALDKTPVLGLDLQGGVSVVLSPKGDYTKDSLDVAIDIIRTRVDSLGTLEPEITRSGSDVVIDLPGVKDREKAVKLVGTTGTLRFRPVVSYVPLANASTPTTTTKPPTTTPGETTTTVPATTTTTLPKTEADAAAKAAIASCNAQVVLSLPKIPTTSRADDTADACIVAEALDGKQRFLLGPTALAGKGGVSGAKARFGGGGWVVDMSLTDSGSAKFNALAAKSFGQTSPTDQVAIVLDGIVQSNPAFQTSTFSGGQVQISGNFTQSEATDLAKLIQYGGLPVVFERGNVETVSPSLGKDQLHAGIIAGIIGLGLVAIYMLVFYRLLGLVVIAGIMVSGMALYTLVAWVLPDFFDITIVLGLAGVTGIIVSVGITVDSYIVYFERMKDELRAGATVRTCVDRSFVRSFRTILAADLVSLIGAGVLYFLAIGSVRGFALFLGISTLLDLLVSYFFMHPIVSIMARHPKLVRMKGFGIGSGLDHPEVVA